MNLDDLMLRATPWLGRSPLSGAALAERLKVSQPTVSRLLGRHRDRVLTMGKGPATRHVLRRSVGDVPLPIPIHEIDASGASRIVARLHPVGDRSFHVESACADVDEGFFDDWPWFLSQLRPAGFLGRYLSALHPTLGLPEDPRYWSSDQLLRYLAHHGTHGSGALIVGEPAFHGWLVSADGTTSEDDPKELYPRLVKHALAGAPPGSSAGGEQPKFLVSRSASRPERLVKFSPPIAAPPGRRTADILLTEHHALETLIRLGVAAAPSKIVEIDDRVFLETVRFDRTAHGRFGLLALEAFDLQFVGDGGRNRWPSLVRRLVELGQLPSSVVDPVDRLHAFGHLIGNNDMHTGNLSFRVRGHRALCVAPAYDMAPMSFAPVRGELPTRELSAVPTAELSRRVWEWAIAAAAECWRRVARDPRVSPDFRAIAASNAEHVAGLGAVTRRLPS